MCIEPPWKMLLSNKAILPILCEIAPNHPNLLAASPNESELVGNVIQKPIWGREGQNILLKERDQVTKTEGIYNELYYLSTLLSH